MSQQAPKYEGSNTLHT